MNAFSRLFGSADAPPQMSRSVTGEAVRSKVPERAKAHAPAGQYRQAPDARRSMQALRSAVEGLVDGASGSRIVAFASARPGEGKTTVVGEFATMLSAARGCSILVIDAGPSAEFTLAYGKASSVDLSRLDMNKLGAPITGAAGAVVTVRVDVSDLSDRDPAEAIGGLIRKLRQEAPQFDYVLIDLPSVLQHPWSLDIGRLADGVVLVVEAERTRWPVVEQTKRAFEMAEAQLIGVFLNKRRFYIPKRVYDHL